jgi:hypothetical protein
LFYSCFVVEDHAFTSSAGPISLWDPRPRRLNATCLASSPKWALRSAKK